MRWKLPGTSRTTALPAGVLLLPSLLLTAPQQLSLARGLDSQNHDGIVSSSVSLAPGPTGHSVLDESPNTYFRHTYPHAPPDVKKGNPDNDVSALATLALAGSDGRAVRAPPAQPSSHSAGLVPQLQARSLQDWEVEDFVLLATVDGTIHARDRKTGAPRWALEVPSSPMVESIYHRANRSASGLDSDSSSTPEDDFLWIVEPSRDGNLYIYSPGPNGGLQKLGLTVKDLVDETPYSGTDPAVTYTARKETTLYTVDARTGNILRVFSSRGPITPEQSCRPVDRLADSDDEDNCEPTTGTLTIGRIEYAVAIQNTETGAPICTLKYSEWAANNRDMDLQSQYYRTMDQSHIYSMHDGVVLGFDHSRMERPRYTQRFSSPVVRVFDVARPINVDNPDQPTPLVLLSQPLEPPDPDYATTPDMEQRVYIDCTDAGGWYAMSEATYPLVTGRAAMAQCYEKDFFQDGQSLLSLDLARQREALAGVHSLNERPVRDRGRRPTIHSISGPSSASELSNDTPGEVARPPSHLISPPALRNSVIIRKGWDNALDIFVTLVLLFLGLFVYFNSHHLQELLKQKLDLKNIIAAYGQPLSTPPSSPVVGVPSSSIKREPSPAPAADVRPELETPRKAGMRPDDAADVDDPGQSTPRPPRQASPSPAPDATPKVRIREPSQGGVERIVDQIKTLTPPSQLEPDIQLARTASNEIVEVDGAIRIGQLKVFTDTVLGHGSHGTVVYKGSFDGRDVAVKRMLVEFYDIASHEVGLLQESDDHSNVIRYYCREQAAGFLYIALELCPASLQDLIERPGDYPQLVNGGLDVPDILRQITAGVRYLHSLKIVHRDLKPQNILVAAPRGRAFSKHPPLRMLISDFGLCKKLEDNQSSFRATTAHAAGTSGWRAPELLVDDDQQPSTTANGPITESQHTESSEPAVVDPQTNRRATRAIDIFSLGCVFYYVLTRGGHPYDKDGKFMREANIVKGNHNLEDLQRLGDYAFEADDLIRRMLSLDPRQRPDATTVLMHPFFWSAADRLSFLCDMSDHFEFEPRDPPSPALLCLESVAPDVMGPDMDFLKFLPKDFKDSLGKQRKYTGSKMLDLLRALRNKRNHYNDMPEHLKAHIGGLPEGYLRFWAVRFPSLLMSCHRVAVQLDLCKVERFKRYFTAPDLL
ncbi:Protein kinase and ribonuclease Ire1 [Rasamsonia emersonii CBS 393.64]|uniref:non-specific serine/threonine protein kinase n=1 Tax=Rasamsonia emersonii (strain ATCC 16479 / CBS 393.64 / IMI 116815) TaxID=1408163 RepID=A0A0F4YU10_RASE3|nr:Protein kinase and ribonuclease Ire1 [Rasamsonia emersonii CBS 393.64]KKA21762.1 Protein kinase and ribonuclease Ire1 [Rasamsonia emersonii CBS 393.64]